MIGENIETVAHGDYTSLASYYAKYRPAYSENVLDALLNLLDKEPKEICFADIGAGTGIWTRMVASRGCVTTAVEPNDAMREAGISLNGVLDITWKKGSAEKTRLPNNAMDLLTMASAFHWTDFDKAVCEFSRILRDGGIFSALWNTRVIEDNPILMEIEGNLNKFVPDLNRISSGRSKFCEMLTDRLLGCGYFEKVLYLESRHTENMSPERYMGIWRSVNDIRVQAGTRRFGKFMRYVEEVVGDREFIEATYLTRCWAAKNRS